MFKYNELSDLLNGELVTPIERTRDGVVCIDKNNNKVVYSFNDFDFNKKISERIIDNSSSDDSDDVINFDNYEYDGDSDSDDKYEYLDDSSDDNSSDSSNDDSSTDLNKYGKEWILSDFEKAKVLHKFGYRPKRSIRQVNIIKKEIN